MEQHIKDIFRNILVVIDIMHVSTKETIKTLFRGREFRLKYIESRMLVVAHSLEKGMSMKMVKRGFGVKKAKNLCYYIKRYLKEHPTSTCFALIESLGILKQYQTYQKECGFDLNVLNNTIDNIMVHLTKNQKMKLNCYKYGVVKLENNFFKVGESVFYENFVKSRRSARSYSEKNVSHEIIKKAVELTNYAPSACNRQPCKVYVALGKHNATDIRVLLDNKAFTKDANNFAIITCDRAYFAGDEHFQWYINGGIYLSNFVYALHSLGIGSCIMQWFAFSKNEKRIKKLLGISDTEAIIASVSLGYYPKEITCICAQRMPVTETLIEYRARNL